MRDREWLTRAKDQVQRDLHEFLTKSNGLTIIRPAEPLFTYKYCLGNGNNPALVKAVLGARPWWVQVPFSEKQSAHLLWTQWKDPEFFSVCEVSGAAPPLESTKKPQVQCTLRYEMLHQNYNGYRLRTVDMAGLGYDLLTVAESYGTAGGTDETKAKDLRMHNRLEGNYHLANKKGLFYNMKSYYEAIGQSVGEVLPLTFHVISVEDPTFEQFQAHASAHPEQHWILKPGENTNRGNGITLCQSLTEIQAEVQQYAAIQHTTIIQQYLHNPFLINGRKFDIRCFALVTAFNGVLQAYFYLDGYLRTASHAFSLTDLSNKFVHLTNDAVQQKSEYYGKFENANKLSYSDFQRYLDKKNYTANFLQEVVPQLRQIVKDTVAATFLKLNPSNRRFMFEVLGYDFLLDEELKPWLLEVNTNPCLELASPNLSRIIPAMLDNAFRIAVDPLFQEPLQQRRHWFESLCENKFELIFHSLVDGEPLLGIEALRNSNPLIEDDCDSKYANQFETDEDEDLE